ncbi:regulator of chemotaxis and motility [Candidatus Hydrogenisulfobacillus filiaventi]|uniref:Stage 0 sporulation protein A homolog n=1 Tax=Candidatus Hydrogenisulfobacillus filiaventi TaxID=2707344 RepID=A0A6F8ZDV8_9FIRM|nr:response regulator [Bacillota bacterium]CAB1127947.1 regulator of chemotaxis and motility [Candidatus Hydrogenisulfobacillus filiaventi]
MKILVADDAAFMRMRLKKLLVEHGHTVVEAENGQAAVERYRAEHPDLVLMDITMPELDGIGALKAIRAEDPGAVVIMVSALGQQSMVISAIQAGAKDFIVKPFEPDRVLAALTKWAR